MYTHVNVWQLSDAGASGSDRIAREIADTLRQQGGFHSYMLARTGEREFTAVTIFESESQLDAALEAVAPLVRQRLHPLAAGQPQRRAGDVVFHIDHHEPGSRAH